MSPIVCSLLALVALLAAADADYEYCSKPGLLIGIQSTNEFGLDPIDVPSQGGRFTLPNECNNPNPMLTGSYVQACNKNQFGFAPYISAVDPLNLVTDVDVYCPDGCPYGVTVYVQQYCQ